MTYEEQLGEEIEKLREVIRIQNRIIIDCGVVEELLSDLAWGEVEDEEVPWDDTVTEGNWVSTTTMPSNVSL